MNIWNTFEALWSLCFTNETLSPGFRPFGKLKWAQSSEKNSVIASRSCRLNTPKICPKVSIVTFISWRLLWPCNALLLVLSLHPQFPNNPVKSPISKICLIIVYHLQNVSINFASQEESSWFRGWDNRMFKPASHIVIRVLWRSLLLDLNGESF